MSDLFLGTVSTVILMLTMVKDNRLRQFDIFYHLMMQTLKVDCILVFYVSEELYNLVDALRMAQRKQTRSLDAHYKLSFFHVRAVDVEYLDVKFACHFAFLGLDEIFVNHLSLGYAQRAHLYFNLGIKGVGEHSYAYLVNPGLQPLIFIFKVLIFKDANRDFADCA